MKLARYWSRGEGEATGPDGERVRVVARGWSDENIDSARARARDIARRVAERLLSHPGQRNQYQYGDRPLPEPVTREFRAGGDRPLAVVTRNAYGALVLNADQLMFVDIDREDPKPATASSVESTLSGLFSSLFGKTVPSAPPPTAPPTVADDIRRIAERHRLSVRVYKTAAGYRGLITNAPFRAGTSEAEGLLREFGADNMYVHLCRVQECFRARLTPKPWRCNFHKPPVEFPFETPQVEAQFRRWEIDYNQKAAAYATCRYVATVGAGGVSPEFQELVHYHDQETKASSGLPLA